MGTGGQNQPFDADGHWLLWAPALFILLLTGLLVANEMVGRLSSTAAAAEARDDAGAWTFVSGAIANLNATAVQICSAEAAMNAAADPAVQQRWQTQQITLMAKYETAASDYDALVSERIEAGSRRPWDVSPVAPPVSVSKDHACLKVAAVVAKATPAPAGGVSAAGGGAFPAPPIVPIDAKDRFLTLEQLDSAAVEAGWPMDAGWWPDMRKIIQCETHSLDRYAHNASDPNGGSFGLAQLNGTQHFTASGEDFNQWSDPVVNLRVALWLRTVRGHFGGPGGWMICSQRWGIE